MNGIMPHSSRRAAIESRVNTMKSLSSSIIQQKTNTHPCYSPEAHHRYARIHLPVAPACNINCNYCSRKYDCVNESRPGVTSEVLTPAEALARFRTVKHRLPNLTVAGIAGPGDALANWDRTGRTLELILLEDSDITFCLSTNGLMLPELADDIVRLGVRHVTVTVNCISPEIGAMIYRSISWRGQVYSGVAAAEILIHNQLKGIHLLAERGALVKVNTVMIEGVNDTHIPEVVKTVKELGAFTSNIMPLIPVPGSRFEHLPAPGPKRVAEIRKLSGQHLQQMLHCKQCRADAIGMLGQDCSDQFIKGRKKCACRQEVG